MHPSEQVAQFPAASTKPHGHFMRLSEHLNGWTQTGRNRRISQRNRADHSP